MTPDSSVITELHMSRSARNRYRPEDSSFASDGHVTFSDMLSVGVFAQKINESRDLSGDPSKAQAVKGGQLNAMALIDAILHPVAAWYYRQYNPPKILNITMSLRRRLIECRSSRA